VTLFGLDCWSASWGAALFQWPSVPRRIANIRCSLYAFNIPAIAPFQRLVGYRSLFLSELWLLYENAEAAVGLEYNGSDVVEIRMTLSSSGLTDFVHCHSLPA
jgi:hypothetical protein